VIGCCPASWRAAGPIGPRSTAMLLRRHACHRSRRTIAILGRAEAGEPDSPRPNIGGEMHAGGLTRGGGGRGRDRSAARPSGPNNIRQRTTAEFPEDSA
jgi:hypothetical protein